jgi:hypothetical protein
MHPFAQMASAGTYRACHSTKEAALEIFDRHDMPTRTAVAGVAASILTAVYHMLKNHVQYQELGPDYFVKRDPARIAAKLAIAV